MPTNTKQQLCIKPTGFLVANCILLYSSNLDDIQDNASAN